MTGCATFAAVVNGIRVPCRVPAAVLVGRGTPAVSGAAMKALALRREAMQAAARRLIEQGRYEDDGSILIRQSDLQG